MKSEAAIYLPLETIEDKKPDYNIVSRTQNSLQGAISRSHLDNLNIDTFKFSKNLNLQGKTELTQRYAVGAITKIINGEPITSTTMLDSLFNTYAPAFNATLEQTGYNSVMQMKDAALHGTINASTFLTGFSGGLNAIQDEKDSLDRRQKYGEEIPIDVVSKCDFTYNVEASVHPVPTGKNFMDYIKGFGPVDIAVFAHVKNESAEIWQMSDFSNKIVDAIVKKQLVVFRIGNTIYEDILIKKYEPEITNIYDISFKLTLRYNYLLARESKFSLKKGIRVINAGMRDQEFKNLLAESEYQGEGKVEKVTAADTEIIEQAKKFFGKDKIIIDGQEL